MVIETCQKQLMSSICLCGKSDSFLLNYSEMRVLTFLWFFGNSGSTNCLYQVIYIRLVISFPKNLFIAGFYVVFNVIKLICGFYH